MMVKRNNPTPQAFNVLSFGAEAEEEEEDLEKALVESKGKTKSARDLAKYAHINKHSTK